MSTDESIIDDKFRNCIVAWLQAGDKLSAEAAMTRPILMHICMHQQAFTHCGLVMLGNMDKG